MTEKPSRLDLLRARVVGRISLTIAAITGINVRFTISGILELAGIAAIVCGFYLIAPFLGFIAGGIGLLIIARGIDPPPGKTSSTAVIEDTGWA